MAVNNAIGVQEGYFETRIPIAQKQPFAEDMYLEGGVRYSDYSTSGGVTTFKVGGQWTPVESFTLRGSYDRAIRAASILEAFTPHLAQLRRRRRHYILSGDWNIAHRPIDLKNWKANRKNSGFLPEERAWMERLFGNAGYVDAFREVRPGPDLYTWWSNRGQARANNVGWRIDYQVVSHSLAGKAHAGSWGVPLMDFFAGSNSSHCLGRR